MKLNDLFEKIIYTITYLNEKNVFYKKYRLNKIENYFVSYNFDKIKLLTENTRKIENKRVIYNKKIKETLHTFHDVLKNKLPEENLYNFYNNINGLKVFINRTFFNKFFSSSGIYKYNKNYIFLNEITDECIYHELLHLSSNRFDENNANCYCGFMFCDKNSSIGYGINEGYTEYLTQKFFDVKQKSYIFETLVAHYLEQIIGEDKMQKFYFNGDLYGLYKELLKYSKEFQIKNFINRLDYYTTRGSEVKTGREKEFNINQEDKIINYLITIYNNKITNDSKLRETEIYELRKTFINSLMQDYYNYYEDFYNCNNKSK